MRSPIVIQSFEGSDQEAQRPKHEPVKGRKVSVPKVKPKLGKKEKSQPSQTSFVPVP